MFSNLHTSFYNPVDCDFDEAEITFEIDSQFASYEYSPKIYYVNEDEQTFEEVEEQRQSGNKIIAKVTHFSSYIVVDENKFFRAFVDEINPYGKSEVVFIVDTSLQFNDDVLIQDWRIPYFKDVLKDDTTFSLIESGETLKVLLESSKDKDKLINLSKNISESYLRTNKNEDAMNKAIDILEKSTAESKKIILLTNRGTDYDYVNQKYIQEYYSNIVQRAKSSNININFLGHGRFSGENMAKETGGKLYHGDYNTDLPYYEMLGYLEAIASEILIETEMIYLMILKICLEIGR